jgi:hypothetical protein
MLGSTTRESASQCSLMPLETCSLFLGRMAIRCSSHSRDQFQLHLKRPRVHRLRGDRRPDFNRKGGRARAVDCRFLEVLGRVIWVNA